MSDKATQVRLEEPGLAAIFHDWYKNQPNGEATLEQKIAIQEGKLKAPPGGHWRMDMNPTFEPPITRREDGYLLEYPDWLIELLTEGGTVIRSATLNRESPAADGFVGIVGPETPDSFFNRSLGYAPMFSFDPQAFAGERTQLRFTGICPTMESPVKVIPWVSQL